MKRRAFLKGAGTLAVASIPFVAARQGSAQQPIVIKLGNVQQVDQTIQIGLKKFGDLVAERTNNRIKVQIFPASQLGSQQEMLEAVQIGSLHMYEGGIGSVGRFLRELEAFALPYIWTDIDHMLKTVRGPIGTDLANRLVKSQGLRVLDFGWLYGYRYLTTKNKAIYKPEDLRGMKIRVVPEPIYLEIFRALGANPVPMNWGEVYLGLQTGVIDGQENPSNPIATAKLYEVQKYLSLTGHNLQNQAIIINEKLYQSFSPAFQQVLREAAVEAGNFQNGLVLEQEKADIDLLKQKGMIIVQPDVNAFREATKDVWKKFAEKWEPGFYEKIQRFQAELK